MVIMVRKLVVVCSIFIIGALSFWYMTRQRQENELSQASETWIVGTNAEYPPFTFKENDTFVGFDIDLITEIAAYLNKKIEIRDMPFDALIPAAQLGSIQIIAAGITATPERAQSILFTKPYLNSDVLIIISKSADHYSSLPELQNKTVIVNEGFTFDEYMSKKPGINLLRLPSVADAFMALRAEQADAFVATRNTAQPFFTLYGTNEFVAAPLNIEGEKEASFIFSTSLGVSPKYPQLLPLLEEAISALEKNGTIDRLKHTWQVS